MTSGNDGRSLAHQSCAGWRVNTIWKRSAHMFGSKLGRIMVLDVLWNIIIGNETHDGYEAEITSGLKDGVGID